MPKGVKGFQKGNRLGQGKPSRPEIDELRRALELAHKHNKKSFLEHFVQQAYTDNHVAIALAKKLLPDMTHNKNDDLVKMMMMPFIERDGKPVVHNVGD